MRLIKEDVIISNINKILANNELILVLKDNAYGFGLCYMVNLARKLNINEFAVKSVSEGIFIRSIYNSCKILILGKVSKDDLDVIKKYKLTPTINDFDDYLLFKENKIPAHLAIDTGMNRFGMKAGYLSIINDSIVKEIYTHLYSENCKSEIKGIEQIARDYQKPLHIGGSIAYNNTKSKLRVGKIIYENALYFFGKIVNIKVLNPKETVGYDGLYKSANKCLIGICDIGYSDGLNLMFNGNVQINGYYYQVVGRCCMDQCFILIDEQVKIGDEVEFFGKNITEDEFIKNNRMTKHEMFLKINRQNIS